MTKVWKIEWKAGSKTEDKDQLGADYHRTGSGLEMI